MSKKVRKHMNGFVTSFTKALGIIGAIIIGIGLIVGVYFGIRALHDSLIANQYEKTPSYSKDNSWGGLAVNVVIEKKIIKEPIPPKTRDCNSPEEKGNQDFINKFPGLTQNNKGCVQGESYGGYEGGVYLEGKIYVKSNYWNDARIIPVNLLTFNHDNKEVKPKLQENIFGRYINPGKGDSTKFIFEEAYTDSSKMFELNLNDGNYKRLLTGDSIEAELK